MLRSNLSIRGLYEYDNTLFDEFHIPNGLTLNVLVALIIMNCAELEVIYPNPVVMKTAIGYWSTAMLPVWDKLWATMNFDYNPIHNKNATMRDEETTDKQRATTGGNEQHIAGHEERNEVNDTETHATEERKVSAYNSNDYENRDIVTKDATAHSNTDTTGDVTQNSNAGYHEDEGQGIHRIFHHHEEGNIGVTTTQQMIKEERDVDLFNIYYHILADFKKQFCLLVY